MYPSIIRYVVAIFRRYNFEGLSCIYRRRVIRGARWTRGKFKGTRQVDCRFLAFPEVTLQMGGIFDTPIQIFEFPLQTHPSNPEFCDESFSCCYVSAMSIVFEV